MGIAGLLPLLKSIHKPCKLEKFRGKTLGVDAYVWLHRGVNACPIELALGEPTTRYVDYALKQVRMLLHFGVQPYLVFDGDHLPSKAETERDRYQRRKESKEHGLALYHAGRTSRAHQELQRAMDVTPQMARHLIDELNRMRIPYIVAPYEADAQLAYLEKRGIIDGVVTEDSDLLVFGVKRLLTKLDSYGNCIEINRADFAACRDISLIGWTDTDFRCMAILAGCDYLSNINRVGIKTAYRYVRKYKNIEKILKMLSFDGQFCVPPGYLEKFKQAEIAFVHHRVFCPTTRQMVFLNDLQPGMKEDEFPFLGEHVVADVAIGVACGELHPMNKQPLTSGPKRYSRGLEPRRITIGSTQEIKAQRPLDGWIKPKRVPLAELDPNSLNYSPSQIRMIEANTNVSWERMSVHSAPQPRRSTSILPNRRGTPTQPPAERKAFLARAANATTSDSTPKSSKRQRLCTDIAGGSSPTALKVSPFFRNNEPSPTLRKRSQVSKKKETEFNIFSDDSVEEAMMELRDLDDATLISKAQVHAEEPHGVPKKIFDKEAQEDNVKLTDLQDPISITLTRNSKEAQNEGEKIKIGRAALQVKPVNAPAKHRIATGTPKDGHGILRASKSMQELSSKPPEHLDLVSQNATCTTEVDGYDSDSPISRRPGPLPAGPCGGSEDLLVPNSEDEGEQISETEECAKCPSLNLGKFKFAPR